jgi:Tfp pilus assembly protein PilN
MAAVRLLARIGLVSLLAAGAFHWWGAQRRVARLEARREALRPGMQGVLAVRDSLTRTTDVLDELARAGRSAPLWSERVWMLATVLPEDAHFTSWRGEGDSLVIEGRAGNPASVMERLRTARGVAGIRATAAVDDAGTYGSAFSVMVRFRTGGMP